MPDYSVDWFSGCHQEQLEKWLKPFAGKQVRALEIGCFEGRSTVWLLENILTHRRSRITCIDTFRGSEEHGAVDFVAVKRRFHANTQPFQGKVQLIVGDSRAIVPTLETEFDFAYIDGSHRADDVFADATATWPKVVSGGIISFDDYRWDHYVNTDQCTKLGIDNFLKTVEDDYTILNSDYLLTLRKH